MGLRFVGERLVICFEVCIIKCRVVQARVSKVDSISFGGTTVHYNFWEWYRKIVSNSCNHPNKRYAEEVYDSAFMASICTG